MDFKLWLTITSLVFTTVLARTDDLGPQTFEPLRSSSQQTPQYQTKEVIMYLTPSQIKALESGQGIIKPAPETLSEFGDNNQEKYVFSRLSQDSYDDYSNEYRKQWEFQDAYQNQQNEEPTKSIQNQREYIPPPPVEEPDVEKPLEPTPQFDWYPKPQEEVKLNPPITEHPTSIEFPHSYTYFSLYNKKKPENNVDFKIYHPIPHDVKWNGELETEHIIKSLNSQKQKTQNLEEELLKWNNSPRYGDQKRSVEPQKYIPLWKKIRTDTAKEETPSIFDNREIKAPKKITKLKSNPLVKTVKVLQRYLTRVPHPVEDKVSKPYSEPYGITRHFPIRAEKEEADKPYLADRTASVEVQKEGSVEIPVRKPQKLTLIRHVWRD